jgi:hypothetical protein
LSKICLNSHNTCFVKPLNVSSETLISENLSNCSDIALKDLAHYFVQINKQFYCDTNNKLINIEEAIKNKITISIIPENEKPCYQQIYNDLYLTPKETSDINEENTKKIIQTPISSQDQNPNDSNINIRNQLNQNFSPDGTSAGLSGLRPENDK